MVQDKEGLTASFSFLSGPQRRCTPENRTYDFKRESDSGTKRKLFLCLNRTLRRVFEWMVGRNQGLQTGDNSASIRFVHS